MGWKSLRQNNKSIRKGSSLIHIPFISIRGISDLIDSKDQISHCQNNSIIHSKNCRNRGNSDTTNTHKNDRLLSWIGTGTLKKSKG